MGGKKKKAAKKVETKKKVKMPKLFKCPYCGHADSCEVKLSLGTGTGRIECRVCGQSHTCAVHPMMTDVDVYCDWTDSIEAKGDEPREVDPAE